MRAHDFHDQLQDRIAGGMAMGLVDLLEEVDVQQDDAHVPALVAAARPGLQQRPGLGQAAAVAGLGERIEQRRARQLACQLAIGDRQQRERQQDLQRAASKVASSP